MSTVYETIQHFGICSVCKNKCKVKYASFEECPKFEWVGCVDFEMINSSTTGEK